MSLERTVAGHRVLRMLARGDRSRVFLAAGDLVVKVLTAPLASAHPALEAQALYRARGEHVVELIDVSLSDDEQVLVFPRLPRGSIADVLTTGRGLDAGEAVTVLAPVAATLARMHSRGVAHGALSASHVLFRSDGAPMLIGFGSAVLFDPDLTEVVLERLPGVVGDREALAALTQQVLARVTGARAAAGAALAARLLAEPLLDLEARLQHELFELAAARPVVFDAPVSAIEPSETRQSETPGPIGRAVSVAVVPEPPVPMVSAARFAGLSVVLEAGPTVAVRDRVRRVWAGWSPRRRQVTVGLAIGAAILVVAISATPTASSVGPSAAIVPTASGASQVDPGDDEVLSGVMTDDPLAALPLLLDRREQCFRDLSVLCLDDVDEQGSSALDADRAALDTVTASGSIPSRLSAQGAVVVERLGDSVLIGLGTDSDPASVLLLKGEAGWRIRDYLSG